MARTRDEVRDIQQRIQEQTGFFMGERYVQPRTWQNEIIEPEPTEESLLAEAQRLAAKRRKSAGLRALKAKYGHDGAQAVVSRHAGRSVHLQ